MASIPVLVAALLSAMAPASAQESAPARDRSATVAAAAAGKAAARPAKKSLPIVQPEEKPETPSVTAANAPSDEAAGLFEEIEFGGTLVIEGKVEKPQVQFTLVKEPPPEKEIRFETSFLQSLLKQERENTFRP